MNIRKKNRISGSESEKFSGFACPGVCKNVYLDEKKVLEIVEVLQSEISIDVKKESFNLVAENIEWMHDVRTEVIVSLQEVLVELFVRYEKMRENILYVLSEIFIRNGALFINYYKFCDFEIWPFCNQAFSLLGFLSWFDEISSIMVKKGLFDYLYKYFDLNLVYVFSVLSNVASGGSSVKKSLLDHQILSFVISNTDNQDLDVRERASLVIFNLSEELPSELLEILLRKLNRLKIVEALSMPGDNVVLNYLYLLGKIKSDLGFKYIDSSFYEKFYYSENEEISIIARNLLSSNS